MATARHGPRPRGRLRLPHGLGGRPARKRSTAATPIEVSGSWLVLKEPDALIESWNALQSCPPSIVERRSTIRTFLYDLANFANVLKGNEWQITAWGKVPAELMRVRFAAEELAKASVCAKDLIC
jgi:hypothetical protein